MTSVVKISPATYDQITGTIIKFDQILRSEKFSYNFVLSCPYVPEIYLEDETNKKYFQHVKDTFQLLLRQAIRMHQISDPAFKKTQFILVMDYKCVIDKSVEALLKDKNRVIVNNNFHHYYSGVDLAIILTNSSETARITKVISGDNSFLTATCNLLRINGLFPLYKEREVYSQFIYKKYSPLEAVSECNARKYKDILVMDLDNIDAPLIREMSMLCYANNIGIVGAHGVATARWGEELDKTFIEYEKRNCFTLAVGIVMTNNTRAKDSADVCILDFIAKYMAQYHNRRLMIFSADSVLVGALRHCYPVTTGYTMTAFLDFFQPRVNFVAKECIDIETKLRDNFGKAVRIESPRSFTMTGREFRSDPNGKSFISSKGDREKAKVKGPVLVADFGREHVIEQVQTEVTRADSYLKKRVTSAVPVPSPSSRPAASPLPPRPPSSALSRGEKRRLKKIVKGEEEVLSAAAGGPESKRKEEEEEEEEPVIQEQVIPKNPFQQQQELSPSLPVPSPSPLPEGSKEGETFFSREPEKKEMVVKEELSKSAKKRRVRLEKGKPDEPVEEVKHELPDYLQKVKGKPQLNKAIDFYMTEYRKTVLKLAEEAYKCYYPLTTEKAIKAFNKYMDFVNKYDIDYDRDMTEQLDDIAKENKVVKFAINQMPQLVFFTERNYPMVKAFLLGIYYVQMRIRLKQGDRAEQLFIDFNTFMDIHVPYLFESIPQLYDKDFEKNPGVLYDTIKDIGECFKNCIAKHTEFTKNIDRITGEVTASLKPFGRKPKNIKERLTAFLAFCDGSLWYPDDVLLSFILSSASNYEMFEPFIIANYTKIQIKDFNKKIYYKLIEGTLKKHLYTKSKQDNEKFRRIMEDYCFSKSDDYVAYGTRVFFHVFCTYIDFPDPDVCRKMEEKNKYLVLAPGENMEVHDKLIYISILAESIVAGKVFTENSIPIKSSPVLHYPEGIFESKKMDKYETDLIQFYKKVLFEETEKVMLYIYMSNKCKFIVGSVSKAISAFLKNNLPDHTYPDQISQGESLFIKFGEENGYIEDFVFEPEIQISGLKDFEMCKFLTMRRYLVVLVSEIYATYCGSISQIKFESISPLFKPFIMTDNYMKIQMNEILIDRTVYNLMNYINNKEKFEIEIKTLCKYSLNYKTPLEPAVEESIREFVTVNNESGVDIGLFPRYLEVSTKGRALIGDYMRP